MRMIQFLGVDGAGKTTLTETLVQRIEVEGGEAARFYGRYFPFLLKMVKGVVRRTAMKGTNQRKDYNQYLEQKHHHVQKRAWAAWGYGLLWIVDYLLTTWVRLLPVLGKQTVLVDRYYLDMVVYLGVSLNLNDRQLIRVAQVVSWLLPTPAVLAYIEIPIEVAYARKDDIQSLSYLEAHRQRYLTLVDHFQLPRLDGMLPPEALAEAAHALVAGTPAPEEPRRRPRMARLQRAPGRPSAAHARSRVAQPRKATPSVQGDEERSTSARRRAQ